MYIFGHLRLDAFFQPRNATRHFLGVDVDGLLVSLRALSRNLPGGQVCETTAVAFPWKRQALVARPLLDDVGEAERHFSATATYLQRSQRRDVVPGQDKTDAVFIALDLDACRRAPAGVDAFACHLRPDLVANIEQDAFDFVHDGVIDDIVVSNCHFIRF